jgi:hypothetical protein
MYLVSFTIFTAARMEYKVLLVRVVALLGFIQAARHVRHWSLGQLRVFLSGFYESCLT